VPLQVALRREGPRTLLAFKRLRPQVDIAMHLEASGAEISFGAAFIGASMLLLLANLLVWLDCLYFVVEEQVLFEVCLQRECKWALEAFERPRSQLIRSHFQSKTGAKFISSSYMSSEVQVEIRNVLGFPPAKGLLVNHEAAVYGPLLLCHLVTYFERLSCSRIA